jgi:molecular chaperone DnaK
MSSVAFGVIILVVMLIIWMIIFAVSINHKERHDQVELEQQKAEIIAMIEETVSGITTKGITNEALAVALPYGLREKKNENILIYYLGSETFDISVLDIGEGTFQLKSKVLGTHSGGDEFDQRIIDWLCDEFKRAHDIDLRKDKMALQRLKEAAEKAKIELSAVLQTDVNLPFITTGASGPKHMSITLSRPKLEQLVKDLVEKNLELCKQAVTDAGKTATQIDEVILIDGQTKMPLIQQKVEQFFGKEPNKSVNLDELETINAAIQNYELKTEVSP